MGEQKLIEVLNKLDIERNCKIVQYGEEERLCRKCGYVLWEEEGKSNDEIIDNMINAGYDAPSCRSYSYPEK